MGSPRQGQIEMMIFGPIEIQVRILPVYGASMSAAILLIAHGSRRADANADLVRVAAALKTRLPGKIVEIAYLELAQPDIPHGLLLCVEQGATSIRLLPYFLSAGAHVTEDLEMFRSEFQDRYPALECRLCPPLGLHPLMIDILLARLEELLPGAKSE